MRKFVLILFSLLLIGNQLFANGNFRVFTGATVSYFVNAQNAKPKVGLSLGLSFDFNLYKKLSFYSGVGFASRGAILENRTIAPYASEPADAFYQDIHGMLGYIEIPATVQYEISVSRKIKFRPFLGPIFTFPIKDLTRFEKREFFDNYIPGQSNLLDYNFWFEQESVFNNNITKMGFVLGFRLGNEKIGFEFRYVLDNRQVYHFDSLSEIRQKMNSIYFLITL